MDVTRPISHRSSIIKAILLWTLHDYPGFGEISGTLYFLLLVYVTSNYLSRCNDSSKQCLHKQTGLSTAGHNACPICGPSLVTKRPSLLGKVIYPNNHRFLPPTHSKYLPPSNGKQPLHWNMSDWAKHWDEHHAHIPPNNSHPRGMSRYSILLTLPYQAKLKIQHLLDPMHVFKNVGQALWDHIIGKKDSLGAREDLRVIRCLPPSASPRMGTCGKAILPKAPWILSKVEQERMKGFITSICTSIGYMCLLRGAFTKTKQGDCMQLYGLKSHDWHTVLQVINHFY